MIRIIFTVIAVYFVMQIARESLGEALLIGCFLFLVLLWMNNPRSHRAGESNSRIRYSQADKIAREQNELINKK